MRSSSSSSAEPFAPGGIRACTDSADGRQATDVDAVARGVGAEQAVGVGVLAGEQQLDLAPRGHHGASAISRSIPVTGTTTQSGRFSSS